MAGTLAYAKHNGILAKTAEEAYKIITNSKYHTVILYNSVEHKLDIELNKLFNMIKSDNTKVSDINQQWLPTNPYYWDDIDGCLGVKCAEVSMNTYEKNGGGIAMFTGWNYSVLNKIDAKKRLDSKTLTTLAMLGSMI